MKIINELKYLIKFNFYIKIKSQKIFLILNKPNKYYIIKKKS